MRLRHSFRVHPTPGQQQSLARAFGCARVVFNDGLRARQQAREAGEAYLSDGELSKRVITQAKRTPEREWLGEASAVVLQQALADLNTAYRNFFASVTGKRKGRKVAPPRFQRAQPLHRRRADLDGDQRRPDRRTGPRPDLPDYGTISTIAPAGEGRTVYVGTDDGRVWVTRDLGASWRLLLSGQPWVTRVVVDPQRADRVYVALSAYRTGSDRP